MLVRRDENLTRASIHLEKLEKNASALESWLEEKLKSEGVLDRDALSVSLSVDVKPSNGPEGPDGEEGDEVGKGSELTASSSANETVPRPSTSSQPTEPSPKPNAHSTSSRDPSEDSSSSGSSNNGGNALGKSITSNFFKTLISQASDGGGTDGTDGGQPPPPAVEVEDYIEGEMEAEVDLYDVSSESDSDERNGTEGYTGAGDGAENGTGEGTETYKQVKTAAVMDRMRNRLTAMGILHGERGKTPEPYVEETENPETAEKVVSGVVDSGEMSDGSGSETEDEEGEGEGGRMEGNGHFPSDNTMIAALKEDLGNTCLGGPKEFNLPSDNTLAAALLDSDEEVASKEGSEDVGTKDPGLPERQLVDSFIDHSGQHQQMQQKVQFLVHHTLCTPLT